MSTYRKSHGNPRFGWLSNDSLKRSASARKTGLARIGLGGGLAIAQVLAAQGVYLGTSAEAGHAQEVPDQPTISVPPPPQVPSIPPQAPLGNPPRETIFQAPTDRANPGKYMVYVNGNSPYLLQQVQTVEPKAFVQQYQGQSIIQAGTFSDEANARRQVEALKMQGISAEIGFASSSYPQLTQSSPYLVIVPGRREELPNLAQQAARMGIRQESVQMKSAPFGWHLEIGPFSNLKEAKEVDRYLRQGGLDSRVYYSR